MWVNVPLSTPVRVVSGCCPENRPLAGIEVTRQVAVVDGCTVEGSSGFAGVHLCGALDNARQSAARAREHRADESFIGRSIGQRN